MNKALVRLVGLVAVLSLGANVLLFERYSSSRPIVRVGKQAISRKAYQDTLDYQTNGQILRQMVFNDLVEQAATQANLMPSSKDVDDRIALLMRGSPQVLGEAASDPNKMGAAREKIRNTIALENLRMRGVTVTDDEVAAFYQAHRSDLSLPPQANTTLVLAENSVDAATAETLLKQNTPVDIIARQPRLLVVGTNGFNPDFQKAEEASREKVSRAVFSMHPGDVQIVPVEDQFVIVRLNSFAQPGPPPLSQIRDEVTRLVKLQKAPAELEELADLYKSAPVTFEDDNYERYFSDLEDAQKVTTNHPQ